MTPVRLVADGRRGGIGGALLFGIGGLVAGLVLGWMVGLGIYASSANCRLPGSCTLMVPVFAMLGGVLGGPVGLVAGLVAGARRRR